MPKQVKTEERYWYAIHTYSGYEDNVARNLKQRVESLGFENKIFNVLVPKEKKIRIKGGKREIIEEKLYAGYVLVEMIVDDAFMEVVKERVINPLTGKREKRKRGRGSQKQAT